MDIGIAGTEDMFMKWKVKVSKDSEILCSSQIYFVSLSKSSAGKIRNACMKC